MLLERRSPNGLWDGLWSLPVLPAVAPAPPCPESLVSPDAGAWAEVLGAALNEFPVYARVPHGFSHFHVEMDVVDVRIEAGGGPAGGETRTVWYGVDRCGTGASGVADEDGARDALPGGVAAQVARILALLETEAG